MDNKNTIDGLGLDQLTRQIKGNNLIVVDPPKPVEEPQSPPVPDLKDDPKTAEPVEKNILNEPISISNATARNVDDNQNPPVPKGNDDASSPFAPFADVLKEQGVLFDDVLEGVDLNSVDGFVEAIQKTIEYNTNNYRQQFLSERSPEAKRFIEMIDQGVPLEEAQRLTTQSLSVKDFTEENLSSNKDLQKRAIESYLKTLDMSQEDIKDQIEYFEDTDKLYEKAKGFSEKLKVHFSKEEEAKIASVKALEEEYKKKSEEQIKSLKDTVYNTAEIIPGKPLNDKVKEKLFASITTPAGQDPNTGQPLNRVALKRLEDPVSFEIKLHYLNELGVFDDKWDGIISSAKTQAVKEFEKALTRTSSPGGNTPVYSPEKPSDEKTKDVVDSFKQLKQQLQQSNFKIK